MLKNTLTLSRMNYQTHMALKEINKQRQELRAKMNPTEKLKESVKYHGDILLCQMILCVPIVLFCGALDVGNNFLVKNSVSEDNSIKIGNKPK